MSNGKLERESGDQLCWWTVEIRIFLTTLIIVWWAGDYRGGGLSIPMILCTCSFMAVIPIPWVRSNFWTRKKKKVLKTSKN